MATWTREAKTVLEEYLAEVEALLRTTNEDSAPVVEDLRAHILQELEDTARALITPSEVGAVLQRMGAPHEVAGVAPDTQPAPSSPQKHDLRHEPDTKAWREPEPRHANDRPGFVELPPRPRPDDPARRIPPVLWVAIISLAIMVLLKFVAAATTNPLFLVDAVLSGALLVGIIFGHKWAYVMTLVFSAFGIIASFVQSPGYGLLVLFLDALVFVPVIMETGYFWPGREFRLKITSALLILVGVGLILALAWA